ncbi:membrane-associated phospholipid phosphatase [Longilinea arvoryzae]|uniref:Membrane-associated phospholipid phosphatase n=1 Tax=Longilinea arvoryzae TaxID=360412 RepID=A0A0S7BF71_9CHLR|nr:phosphatase PAP2 family protein [Longilinea arvoryzae]GAP13604.1 membrane-associated phospholipid phosphatase [Longilinea arvoryzae]
MPEVNVGIWGHFSIWVNRHQPIARLVGLTIGLVVFLVFLPPDMRIAYWEGLRSHKILASMLLVFSLLAVSLVWTAGQKVDAWAFLAFNLWGPRPLWLDRMMLGFTQIGSGIAALTIGLVLFLTGNHLFSYKFLLGTLALWLVVELLKFLVHRSRPFIRLAQTRTIGNRANGRSFPSGHTSQAFFMATLIAQHFHMSVWVVLLLYTTAFLVGITRMYVGAHYPRDVLAGAILGSAWGLLGMMVSGNGMTRIG